MSVEKQSEGGTLPKESYCKGLIRGARQEFNSSGWYGIRNEIAYLAAAMPLCMLAINTAAKISPQLSSLLNQQSQLVFGLTLLLASGAFPLSVESSFGLAVKQAAVKAGALAIKCLICTAILAASVQGGVIKINPSTLAPGTLGNTR